MGAYYTPTALTNEKTKNYQTIEMIHGLKLMEHSYFGNPAVNSTLFMIENSNWKNKSFTWACDYSDNISGSDKNIYELSEKHIINPTKKKTPQMRANGISFEDMEDTYNNVIILNNSKKEYLDLSEYVANYKFDKKWMTHPFPLLTNSETQSMGGGDYHLQNDFRGIWSNDKFEVVRSIIDVPASYKNISSDFYFYANEEDEKQSKDLMKIKVLRSSLEKDRTNLENEVA